ncbi:MAG: hypothetical protein IKH49_04620, partial [Bacteroidales bacterium]|nr:hypothetical protein [Bacteroidales bacterium]
KIIEYMLAEDEGFGDITSDAVVDNGQEVSAYIVSKDEGILAGINVANGMVLDGHRHGQRQRPGERLRFRHDPALFRHERLQLQRVRAPDPEHARPPGSGPFLPGSPVPPPDGTYLSGPQPGLQEGFFQELEVRPFRLGRR